MDFEQVIPALVQRLNDEGIHYGVIGGFALGLLGSPRATMDVDFLVHRDDLGKLHDLLTRLGYQRDVLLENVSQYYHPVRPWGSIDVIHAFRPYALEMLARARTIPFPGTNSIRVLQPEDIIGLKVQAIANNPARRAQEIADIETLASQHGHQLDWDRIQLYYNLFELEQDAKSLRARYGREDQS
ncbi:MAG: hypothetical protein A3B78_02540 [Omnitrophica WOR_2 bacterium RIFCSPHIGHO2_02_FULL_67_20]|nr:MAG: hypothetical protein A3B78_02540 [Omnitrophica WOR_2 bacterium RIFCSPHIGHO2_02_FULL_67_20]